MNLYQRLPEFNLSNQNEKAPAVNEGPNQNTTTTSQLNYSIGGGCGQGENGNNWDLDISLAEAEKKKPVLLYRSGKSEVALKKLLHIIHKHEIPLYEFNNQIVVFEYDDDEEEYQIVLLNRDTLRAFLKEYIKFVRETGQGKHEIECPVFLASVLLGQPRNRLKRIKKIIRQPILEKDGTILLRSGYYPQKKFYFVQDFSSLNVPEKPTKEDAQKAAEFLLDLIREYPIQDGLNKSVALAYILSSALRDSYSFCPLLLVRSPAPGCGKSTFGKMCSVIYCGFVEGAVGASNRNDELEKRIESAYFSNIYFIHIDNYNKKLDNDTLGQSVTEERLLLRRMRTNEMPRFNNHSIVFVNGNNVEIGGDLPRRSLVLDFTLPRGYEENPSRRKFEREIIEYTKQNRHRILEAVLTIVKAYFLSGERIQTEEIEGFSGFDEWCMYVREPLMWLGFEDVVKSKEKVQREASEKITWGNIFELGYLITEGKPFKVNRVVDMFQRRIAYIKSQVRLFEPLYRYEVTTEKNMIKELKDEALKNIEKLEQLTGRLESERKKLEAIDCDTIENAGPIRKVIEEVIAEARQFIEEIEEVLSFFEEQVGTVPTQDETNKRRIRMIRLALFFDKQVNKVYDGIQLVKLDNDKHSKSRLWQFVKIN